MFVCFVSFRSLHPFFRSLICRILTIVRLLSIKNRMVLLKFWCSHEEVRMPMLNHELHSIHLGYKRFHFPCPFVCIVFNREREREKKGTNKRPVYLQRITTFSQCLYDFLELSQFLVDVYFSSVCVCSSFTCNATF